MPNGGLDNCGVCGFNRANEGVWGRQDYTADERLDNAYCTIRGVPIENALWTYCLNCHTREPTPDGPICMVGLNEKARGYLYARIPWHGNWEPKVNVPGTCRCGRFTERGIAVETAEGEEHFCCNSHYVKWWHQQHPNESHRWEPKSWPEPPEACK